VAVNLSDMPRKGTFLKSMTEFDHSSFGISSDDARLMPNSARRLMELSFRALLDSGIQTRGQSVGCFMSGNNDVNLVSSFLCLYCCGLVKWVDTVRII
jgi:acyl transferase domain-containing protein